MLKKVIGAVAVLSTLLCAQIDSVAGVGSVDWAKRIAVAQGVGVFNPSAPQVAARPMAIRAARHIALRNALELIKGLRITSDSTIENCMAQSEVFAAAIHKHIRTYTESEPRMVTDKSIEITVTVPMNANLMEMALPKSITDRPRAAKKEADSAGVQPHTGLIIDARGYQVVPALMPRVLDEKEKEIYGAEVMSRKAAVEHGVVAYVHTPEEAAMLTDRIGKAPMIVKANRGAGSAALCDIVLSNADAERVQGAVASTNIFAECRVVFIVD